MSWFNLNDSINNIKGQITSFANDVLAEEDDKKELQIAHERIKELEELCATQLNEIEVLRRQNAKKPNESIKEENEKVEDASWSWSSQEPAENSSANESLVEELKKQIYELENTKKELESSLVQLDLDCQQTVDKLVNLKDQLLIDYKELEKECSVLRLESAKNAEALDKKQKELHDLRNEFEVVLRKIEDQESKEFSGDEVEKLRKETEGQKEKLLNLQKENKKFKHIEHEFEEYRTITEKENYERVRKLLEKYEEKVAGLESQLSFLDRENEELKKVVLEKEESILSLKNQTNSVTQEEKEDSSKKYLNILAESMEKYINCEKSVDFQQVSYEDDPCLQEYANQVEIVVKLLLDFKTKMEALEKELYELREEKSEVVAEKNEEIEKLLGNSEILSQEVIAKTRTIKEYEEECAQLAKNNELLINQLENYKSSSGLETISESNEDNLVLLETQLEKANNRIKDLELTISDLEKRDSNIESNLELEYIKKQLNITGRELSETKRECSSVLEKYQKLQENYEILKMQNEELKNTVEKLSLENENNEYKYSELCTNQDSLNEDLANYKKICEEFFEENKKFTDEIAVSKIELTELQFSNVDLEATIEELKRDLAQQKELKEGLENQMRNLIEKLQGAKMSETSLKFQLQTVSDAKYNLEIDFGRLLNEFEEVRKNFLEIQNKLEITLLENEHMKKENSELLQKLREAEMLEKNESHENEAEKILADLRMENIKIPQLETQVDELNKSRNELIAIINVKHEENVAYHGEIQRLTQLLGQESEKCHHLELELEKLTENREKNEEFEKLMDQNNFLKEKCEVLASNLLQEQSNLQKIVSEQRNSFAEKEQALTKELERLRVHLVEMEETYTEELLQADRKNKELLGKMSEIEEREKNSSTMYTSVSIRANQQVEAMQTQIQLLTNQREELRKKISDAEDENSKQAAALNNLQFVLEQFQKDKEHDVHQETERIRRQIDVEKAVQIELRKEVSVLKSHLEESRQGLGAASRLSDQLEYSKQQVITLKEEVKKLQEKLGKFEEKYTALTSQTDTKIDKSLIKSLVVGFLSSNNEKDKSQILKIIATVLDFNQNELDKVNLNKSHNSWLNSLLHPQAAGGDSNTGTSNQSLSEAFVRFLERESTPRVIPSLLNSTEGNGSSDGGVNSQKGPSPVVLSEIMLPTFADFAHSRSSGSILKDVLKDNS